MCLLSAVLDGDGVFKHFVRNGCIHYGCFELFKCLVFCWRKVGCGNTFVVSFAYRLLRFHFECCLSLNKRGTFLLIVNLTALGFGMDIVFLA